MHTGEQRCMRVNNSPRSSFRSFTSLSCSAVFEEDKTKTFKFSESLSFFFSINSLLLFPSARTSHEAPIPFFLYFKRMLDFTKALQKHNFLYK